MNDSDAYMTKSFSASYDLTTKMISVAVCVLLGGGALLTGTWIVGIIAVLILGISYALSPRAYTISEGMVQVRRLVSSILIPLHDIRAVRIATKEDLRGCVRVFGNGGLFGYYGVFRTSALGVCHWYVTNRANAVIIDTPTKTYLLSPDDVSRFIEEVKAVAPVPAHHEGGLPGATGEIARKQFHWNAIGVIGLIGVVLLGAAAWLYSPGPPQYTLNPGGLTIHDRFYPVTLRAVDIEVDRMRIVDIGNDPHWRPVARTNGFANTHYRAGWFKVAGGEKVRMYRAEAKRLVLLPSKGEIPTVLLEVAQPEAFIREAQNTWK